MLRIGNELPANVNYISTLSSRLVTPQSLSMLQNKLKINWSESIGYHPEDIKQILFKSGPLPLGDMRADFVAAAKFHEKVAICNMGEYGYGLFAKEEIDAKSCTVYTGNLDCGSFEKYDAIPLARKVNIMLVTFKPDHQPFAWVDSSEARNAATYVQHAPSSESLAAYYFFDESDRAKVATSNIDCIQCFDRATCIPYARFQVREKITAGGQILVDYGYDYWSGMADSPALFDKDGITIDRSKYLGPLTIIFRIEGNPKPMQLSLRTGRDTKGFLELLASGEPLKSAKGICEVPYEDVAMILMQYPNARTITLPKTYKMSLYRAGIPAEPLSQTEFKKPESEQVWKKIITTIPRAKLVFSSFQDFHNQSLVCKRIQKEHQPLMNMLKMGLKK